MFDFMWVFETLLLSPENLLCFGEFKVEFLSKSPLLSPLRMFMILAYLSVKSRLEAWCCFSNFGRRTAS